MLPEWRLSSRRKWVIFFFYERGASFFLEVVLCFPQALFPFLPPPPLLLLFLLLLLVRLFSLPGFFTKYEYPFVWLSVNCTNINCLTHPYLHE
ncbi:hypothetical protein HOY80DRAFT_395450 [Tuber brumale]|nr:hypothetical protein HOY80DRAFT_395450 [Tuber brumale]